MARENDEEDIVVDIETHDEDLDVYSPYSSRTTCSSVSSPALGSSIEKKQATGLIALVRFVFPFCTL